MARFAPSRLAASALGAVLAAALLAACSGGDGGGGSVAADPAAALARAAARTAADDTVKMELSARASESAPPLATGSGAFDFDREVGRFTFSAFGASFEVVVAKDRVYLKTPPREPGGKEWAAVSEDDLGDGGAGGFLSSLRGQIDPREALRNLGSEITDVKVEGTEEVRGVATTHLAGRVEPEGAAAYPIEVWLDAEGRVRRLDYTLRGGGMLLGETRVRLELFGFGEDADITIPDPSTVSEGLPTTTTP